MGGVCPNGVWVEPSVVGDDSEASHLGSSEIALYVGLSMAVLVFLLVVLVAISLIRRRRLPSGYGLAQSGKILEIQNQFGRMGAAILFPFLKSYWIFMIFLLFFTLSSLKNQLEMMTGLAGWELFIGGSSTVYLSGVW